MRITAQLIDGDSDSHLWSETCGREMKVDSDLNPLHNDPCFTRVLQRLG